MESRRLVTTLWPQLARDKMGDADTRYMHFSACTRREPGASCRNGKETKLAGTKRLIVWERITSGEILFEGMGREIDDDVFRVAGRANWVFFD